MLPDTKTEKDATELASYFRAAAEQRHLLEPRQKDRLWIADGKTVLHAADTNIIKLFTDPIDTAVSTKRRGNGYGEVFPDNEQDNAIGASRVLAHFIFFHLCGQKSPPLLLLPPIDQEMRDVFHAVMRDAMREGFKAREEIGKVQKLAMQLGEAENGEERTRLLVGAAPTLFRFLAGTRGPRAEMERFSRLAGQLRIASLDMVMEQGLDFNKVWQQAFQPAESLADRVKIIGWTHAWRRRIKKEAPDKDLDLIENDAKMLARLEWINQRLLGNNTYLVLITGDRSIRNAARTYNPEKYDRNFAKLWSEEYKPNFADLWLRHPRSYLAEPEVLSPESKGHTETEVEIDFINWLDIFLAKTELTGLPTNFDITQDLDTMAANVLKSDPDILEKFKARWTTYIHRIILAHDFKDEPGRGDDKQVADLVRTITEQLDSIEDILKNKVSDAWSGIFETVAEAGYLFVHQYGIRQSRNPPVLLFTTFTATSVFVRQVLDARQQDSITNFVPYMEALRKGALREEDVSGYTHTLAFGVLFAVQGAWAVASTLAKRAVDIAQENNGKNYRITGREAYYLQAVTQRRQIRKSLELADIDALLMKAEEALTTQRKIQPDLLKDDYRFDSERVTLNVSYQSFHRFLNEEIPAAVLSLDTIECQIKELLKLNTVGLFSKLDSNRWVARNVGRALLADLFMVALLRAKRGQPFPPDLEPSFNQFKLSIEDDGKDIPRTFLVDAVYIVTQWWRETEPAKKKKYRDEVLRELRDEQINSYSVMPYDHNRFTYFRDFVEPVGSGNM